MSQFCFFYFTNCWPGIGPRDLFEIQNQISSQFDLISSYHWQDFIQSTSENKWTIPFSFDHLSVLFIFLFYYRGLLSRFFFPPIEKFLALRRSDRQVLGRYNQERRKDRNRLLLENCLDRDLYLTDKSDQLSSSEK